MPTVTQQEIQNGFTPGGKTSASQDPNTPNPRLKLLARYGDTDSKDELEKRGQSTGFLYQSPGRYQASLNPANSASVNTDLTKYAPSQDVTVSGTTYPGTGQNQPGTSQWSGVNPNVGEYYDQNPQHNPANQQPATAGGGQTGVVRPHEIANGFDPYVPPASGAPATGGNPANTGGNPVSTDLDPRALSQHQLAQITSKDSANMQIADTQGKQYANKRGLLNSAGAGRASMAAMIEAAAPFAQQDARAYFEAGESEKDRGWQSGEKALDRDFEAGESSKERGWQSGEKALDRNLQSSENALERNWQSGESEADRGWQSGEKEAERSWQSGEKTQDRDLERDRFARETATELFRQVEGLNASMLDAIAQIQQADMKKADKDAAVSQLTNMYKSSLNSSIALGDFDIVNGQVVYKGGETAQETADSQPSEKDYTGWGPNYNGNWGL